MEDTEGSDISRRDMDRRDEILTGGMGGVFLKVGAPLVLYQCLFFVFQIIDASLSARISPDAVSSVFYISQIITVIQSLGQGIAVGAGIKIATAYGAGEYDRVSDYVRATFLLCAAGCGLTLGLCLPLSRQILSLANTPQAFIEVGEGYFLVAVAGTVVDFFNASYQAMERARNHTRRILCLNIARVAVKLGSAWAFITFWGSGLELIAGSTLAANLAVAAAELFFMARERGPFRMRLRARERGALGGIFRLAVPAALEKGLFYYGKVIVNSMITFYGDVAVGAFGVALSMGQMINGSMLGIQDAASTVINQNYGAREYARVLAAFRRAFWLNLAISSVGGGAVILLREPISRLFSSGSEEFFEQIMTFNIFNLLGLIPMGVSISAVALLYGVGRTKWALILNFSRLFLLRIPLLWCFERFTQMGGEAVGWALVISNGVVAAVSVAMAAAVIKHIRETYGVSFSWFGVKEKGEPPHGE